MTNKFLGRKIREERIKRKLTIEQLAEILGITPSYLGLVERGERGVSIGNLINISNFFEISTDTLLYDEKHEEKEGINEDYKYKELKSLLHNVNDDELNYIVNFVKLWKKSKKSKNIWNVK